MERCGHESILRRGNDRAVLQLREDLDVGTDRFDERRADEDRMERLGAEGGHVEIRLERIELPAEGITANADVHEARERMRMAGHVLRDEDRAGACTPDGHALGDAFTELRDEAVVLGELADRGALAAGNDERIDVVELFW